LGTNTSMSKVIHSTSIMKVNHKSITMRISMQEICKYYFDELELLPTLRRKKNFLAKCQKDLNERHSDMVRIGIGNYYLGEKITPLMMRDMKHELVHVNSLIVEYNKHK